MFLELPELPESVETLGLQQLHRCEGLALARPEGHDFAADPQFVAEFGFFGQVFLQLFDLVLLDSQQGVASASLGVDRLRLIMQHLLLGAHELAQSLRPEINDECVQFLLEVLHVFVCDGPSVHVKRNFLGLVRCHVVICFIGRCLNRTKAAILVM